MAIVGTPFHGLDEYGHVRIRAKAAITKGHFVRTGTNGVQAAGDGTTCFGIAEDAATAAGQNIVVATRGVWKVQNAAAYNPDQGDPVYLDTGIGEYGHARRTFCVVFPEAHLTRDVFGGFTIADQITITEKIG